MPAAAVAGRPSVWIGCLSCLNEGRLVGRWVDAEEACEVAVDDLHDGQIGEGCGEMRCLDCENLPCEFGELSPGAAVLCGELFSEVGEVEWPALCAWVDSGCHVTNADGMPSVSDFEERNRGLWPSFRAFAQEYADDCGLFYQVPEQFATYFDLDKWVWDLEQEFTVVDGLDGVFVFHNL